MSTSFLLDVYTADSGVRVRPMIVVYPSGGCCYVHRTSGARDCRETDELGALFAEKSEFERECQSGNFFVNRRGYAPGDEVRYGDALFELMEHVDRTYRTLPAANLEHR
jgi:hypothetical protein